MWETWFHLAFDGEKKNKKKKKESWKVEKKEKRQR